MALVVAASLAVLSACTAPSGWSATPVPDPFAARPEVVATAPRSVSCVSATWCLAVGGTEPRTGSDPSLVARWDGRRWTAAAGPAPLTFVLNAVSCASSTFCVAVNGISPSLFRWNGTTWADVAPPGVDTDFNDVSCPTTTYCMAAGNAGGTAGVWEYAGGTWHALPSPFAYGGADEHVDCATPDFCIERGGLNVRWWTGTVWAPVPLGHRAGLLSCTAQRWCAASDGTSVSVGVERTWATTVLPGGVVLRRLACASSTECVGTGLVPRVGTRESLPATVIWDGSAWSVRSDLAAAVIDESFQWEDTYETVPTDLSCVPRWCMHVGTERSADGRRLVPAAEQLRR
jgi:hypothetical protein